MRRKSDFPLFKMQSFTFVTKFISWSFNFFYYFVPLTRGRAIFVTLSLRHGILLPWIFLSSFQCLLLKACYFLNSVLLYFCPVCSVMQYLTTFQLLQFQAFFFWADHLSILFCPTIQNFHRLKFHEILWMLFLLYLCLRWTYLMHMVHSWFTDYSRRPAHFYHPEYINIFLSMCQ